MSEKPCELVLAHQQTLLEHSLMFGEICSDLKHIKGKVDNGLSEKLEKVEKALNASISEGAIRAVKIDSENWLNRIMTGSVKKIISYAVLFIVLNCLVSNSLWAFLKINFLKEVPGQQQSILQMQLGEAYHSHMLPGGRILLHAGDPNKAAWVLNPNTERWEPAPEMRTENGLK
jgi:hypothetical protein